MARSRFGTGAADPARAVATGARAAALSFGAARLRGGVHLDGYSGGPVGGELYRNHAGMDPRAWKEAFTMSYEDFRRRVERAESLPEHRVQAALDAGQESSSDATMGLVALGGGVGLVLADHGTSLPAGGEPQIS